ncbi:sel1 repeat family protein [Pseudoxanthomonas indica]|uniref:Sel1 repeat-containing protein n=1 Tax=Pseudoxanthomonas indica TaxID=428993 RepID=A0A1T5KD99_9GAMM|nr:sel1 repeat family protein [Pseudoxanthomonas indica]GGD48568.1 hypothetical protein GCM10007235_20620 [Pseudoxanthomonas indica]SKC61654.1 hypothetical protein SAMN06296058_1601 [Pseudoxanthomonas indica]
MRAGWLLWGWLTVSPAWADDLAEMNAVSKAWDRYAELSQDDQPESVDLMAASSLVHFGFLRDAALYASTDQLRRIPTTDRITVYLLRASVDEAGLKALDDREVARLCMQRGWVGLDRDESEPEPTLSHVTVIGDLAVGEVAPPTETQFQFGPDFVREGQAWKFRYESLIPDSSAAIDDSMKQSGVNTTQMFESVVANLLKSETAPSLAALDRPLLDDTAERGRLNEQWPAYDQVYQRRLDAVAQKAKQGDSFAEFVYGTLKLLGNVPQWVAKDETGGLQLLEKSSDAGNTQAATVVVSYLASDPTLLDDARLRQISPHLQRAANASNANAMSILGTFYFEGVGGLQRDCRRAAEWQARAEEAGAESARNDQVWTWAVCPLPEQRDPARALALAQHLIKQKDTLQSAQLDTVAAALAANGRFEEAAEFQQLAIDRIRAEADPRNNREYRIKRMQSRLAGYRKHRAYVQDYSLFADMRAGRF